ncbi:hypothetical protein CSV78_07915 [Sporosarcina sp. P16a]|nr:hypothetical protein CSV78_07915 [Sporosarcina sp. P16a]PIC92704.1 hypothetical protein CSV70_08665 [Sporosarcina sp. P25]
MYKTKHPNTLKKTPQVYAKLAEFFVFSRYQVPTQFGNNSELYESCVGTWYRSQVPFATVFVPLVPFPVPKKATQTYANTKEKVCATDKGRGATSS